MTAPDHPDWHEITVSGDRVPYRFISGAVYSQAESRGFENVPLRMDIVIAFLDRHLKTAPAAVTNSALKLEANNLTAMAIIPDANWKPKKLWRESNGGLFDSLQKSTFNHSAQMAWLC